MGVGFLGSKSGLVIMAKDEGHPDPESVKDFGELLNWIASKPQNGSPFQKFRNPPTDWEHKGAFSVELMPGTHKDTLPNGAKVHGNTVHVKE